MYFKKIKIVIYLFYLIQNIRFMQIYEVVYVHMLVV